MPNIYYIKSHYMENWIYLSFQYAIIAYHIIDLYPTWYNKYQENYWCFLHYRHASWSKNNKNAKTYLKGQNIYYDPDLKTIKTPRIYYTPKNGNEMWHAFKKRNMKGQKSPSALLYVAWHVLSQDAFSPFSHF